MSADPPVPSRRQFSVIADAEDDRSSLWYSNQERMAWVILLGAFIVFIVLAISIPWAVRYTLHYATVAEQVEFNPTAGTILLFPPRAEEPIAMTAQRDDIGERSRIVTTGTPTQGVLVLSLRPESQDAVGTVHLYPNTTLEIDRLRRPRFSRSTEPYRVKLTLREGRIGLFTNSGDPRPLHATVSTPHGETILKEGSYNFSVSARQTDVTVRQGEAVLPGQNGDALTVSPGLRAWIDETGVPSEPISAERNLVENGSFSQPFTDTWHTEPVAAENVVPGKVEIIEHDGRSVAHFVRRGEEDLHTEIGIRQSLDQDVNGQEVLQIKLDVKLLYQSLDGAGYMGSEFPLRFEMDYTDFYGKDLTWGHGFYYKDPLPGYPLTGGEKIPLSVWYSYESPNLMEVLADTPPSRINSIRVYASGHNYEAMVSEVSLIVE